MEVSSTMFFVVSCARSGSPRTELSRISRYWTVATRPASSDDHPQLQGPEPGERDGPTAPEECDDAPEGRDDDHIEIIE